MGRQEDLTSQNGGAVSYWVYKCNRRSVNGPVFGDWEQVFRQERAVPWGPLDRIPALGQLRSGDTLLAYQTDRNELVGTAVVVGFKTSDGRRRVVVRAVERLGAKVRPLKQADPSIAVIPAFRGGPIATIYAITDADAGRLIDAARAAPSESAPGRSRAPTTLSGEAIEEALESALLAAQGFAADPKLRKIVERFAVERARSHYESLGFDVVERGRPFDLECRRKRNVLHVEVKGTQTKGSEVILTRNEVDHARRNPMELFVVHSIRVTRKGAGYVASGGIVRVVKPWRPSPQDLIPLAFTCAID